ncbi:MAG: 7-cyano-7-deazaguanine synthase [Chitinispirillales bacterium]|jgi:7-cyano-7-deazaguanine synthase|nr:7-cyano-7-deazaguanine synthase [Chitinispirillales bacterium]
MKKAIVLLSGGLDSATCGLVARNMGFDVYALSFSYGQRNAFELLAAQKVAKCLGVAESRIIDIDLASLGGSALTSSRIRVPKGGGGACVPVTYVPARNAIFLTYALAWAEVLGGVRSGDIGFVPGEHEEKTGFCTDIFIGVNCVDYSGYPDCRPEFIAAFQKMANLATVAGVGGHGIKIHTPLMFLSKADIIKIGIKAGFDYGITHSCYDPEPQEGIACGACDSCLIRKKGFREADVVDPTKYVR